MRTFVPARATRFVGPADRRRRHRRHRTPRRRRGTRLDTSPQPVLRNAQGRLRHRAGRGLLPQSGEAGARLERLQDARRALDPVDDSVEELPADRSRDVRRSEVQLEVGRRVRRDHAQPRVRRTVQPDHHDRESTRLGHEAVAHRAHRLCSNRRSICSRTPPRRPRSRNICRAPRRCSSSRTHRTSRRRAAPTAPETGSGPHRTRADTRSC